MTAPAALSPRLTTATAGRVLRQLRHDHRTMAMLLVLPGALLGLLYLIWSDVPTRPGQPDIFDRVGLTMLGIFPFVVMFLVTSIAMLRERTSGTLERLLTTRCPGRICCSATAPPSGWPRASRRWSPSRWPRRSTTSTWPARWRSSS